MTTFLELPESFPQAIAPGAVKMYSVEGWYTYIYVHTVWTDVLSLLGMRTRIFCLAPASQCVNSPTEAARARALLTAREARLPTNLRARRKLDLLRMTEVDIPKRG